MQYLIQREDEDGRIVYLSGCYTGQDHKTRVRSSTSVKRAQLFSKDCAEAVLARVSARWSAVRYQPKK